MRLCWNMLAMRMIIKLAIKYDFGQNEAINKVVISFSRLSINRY